MALVINSNLASLNARRQLAENASDLSSAMERLSSGKRINSAKDDAAGLAIANRMTSQIRGLNQAVRNANDGISMLQVADGALDQSTGVLQRMRELSVQSASGTYSSGDRNAINAEFQQLVRELDRISETQALMVSHYLTVQPLKSRCRSVQMPSSLFLLNLSQLIQRLWGWHRALKG